MSELLDELLAKPVGPGFASRPRQVDLTSEIEVRGDTLTATLVAESGTVDESKAAEFIRDEGLNPDDWEISSWRKGKWGNTESPMESVFFAFKRRRRAADTSLDVDEALETLRDFKPIEKRPAGRYGALVLIGDMQFGKVDGDGTEGTLRRTLQCLANAYEELRALRTRYDIGHVHIAWLGDHIEGFVSQGGANVHRTELTLTEQIRLTRRSMLYALELFANSAERVSMAAVPGNHGETVRFAGKGVTRYDDSHDTESLIGIADMAKMVPGMEHVEFYVPDTDELTVQVEVAGTRVAHHHGHMWRPNKHFEWWKGQAFNRDSAMFDADVLVAGHLHHEHIEADGPRTFIGVPAMESESTWYKLGTGTGGAPGLILALTKDGAVPIKMVISEGGV